MSIADFRFTVEINSRRIGAFTECSLPALEWDVETIQEGGLSSFVHQLPKGRKQAKLTLKRGLGDGRELLDWYLAALQGRFIRKDVTIHLIGFHRGKRHTAFSWTAAGAYPTKWSGPQLQSSGKSVAIETLELACNEISVVYDAQFLRATDVNNRFRDAVKYRSNGSGRSSSRRSSSRRRRR